MPRPTLDEIYGAKSQEKPSLDEIYGVKNKQDSQVSTVPKEDTGKNYIFQQDIGKQIAETREMVRDVVKNAPTSAARYASDIFSALGHPIETAKSVGTLLKSTVKKIIPGEQEGEEVAEAMADFYKQRYGSSDKLKETLTKDPIGLASDMSMVLGIGSMVAKTAGNLAKSERLANLGKIAEKASLSAEPVVASARGIGKGIKNIKPELAPFAKSIDAKVVAAANKIMVDLPAAAKSNSKVVALVESLAGKGFFGETLTSKMMSAVGKVDDYANNVIAQTGKSPDLTLTGKRVAESADKYKKAFNNIKSKLYEKATVGDDILVDTTQTKEFVDIILKRKQQAANVIGKSEDIGYFKQLKNRTSAKPKKVDTGILDAKGNKVFSEVTPEKINGSELKAAIQELNEKLSNRSDPLVTGNRASMTKLVALMADDLDNAVIAQKPHLAEAIISANDFYIDGIKKLNSSFGKSIKKLADAEQYDKIVPAILNQSTSVEDIPKLKAIVGIEGTKSLQSAFLERMFKDARGVEGNFTPGGISRQIKKYGEPKLQALLSPSQLEAVKNIETITKSLGKAEKIVSGSQTAFLGRLMLQASTLTSNPWLGMKLILGDAAFSKLISSKVGQDLLTKGVKIPTQEIGMGIINKGEKAGKFTPAMRTATIARAKQRKK